MLQESDAAATTARSPATGAECPAVNITVAYNVFIWPPQDWRLVVGGQLEDLAKSGLLKCAKVVIAVAVPQEFDGLTYRDLQHEMHAAVSFIRGLEAGKDAMIVQEHENAFEYPAIHSLYRIARSEADAAARNHLFLYFHTKGMVNHGVLTERMDTGLFDATIVPWRAVAQQFIEDSSIRVAGWMPSYAGYVWRNFWWARGDYVKQLSEPKRGVKRHWFEAWLSKAPEDVRNATRVLSTCTCDFTWVAANGVGAAQKKCKAVTSYTCMP